MPRLPLALLAASIALLLTLTAHAADPLPEGPGLAAQYPHDIGLADDPAVLIFEDFENTSLEDLQQRWDSVKNPAGDVLALSPDIPPASIGDHSLQVTATLGENDGGHLYQRFPRPVDTAYARFYVKFADDAQYLHHFVHMGGYQPATAWPQGGAGTRPAGDERITVGIEPFADFGRIDPPGAWNFYNYWHEMDPSRDGNFWGNGYRPAQLQRVPRDRWQCVEFMIKLNSEGDAHDGELALWLDGRLVAHFAPGATVDDQGPTVTLDENADDTFPGFRWRSDEDLKLNFFWLLHYVTDQPARHNNVADPNPRHRVWFDHIVIADQYIGPITE